MSSAREMIERELGPIWITDAERSRYPESWANAAERVIERQSAEIERKEQEIIALRRSADGWHNKWQIQLARAEAAEQELKIKGVALDEARQEVERLRYNLKTENNVFEIIASLEEQRDQKDEALTLCYAQLKGCEQEVEKSRYALSENCTLRQEVERLKDELKDETDAATRMGETCAKALDRAEAAEQQVERMRSECLSECKFFKRAEAAEQRAGEMEARYDRLTVDYATRTQERDSLRERVETYQGEAERLAETNDTLRERVRELEAHEKLIREGYTVTTTRTDNVGDQRDYRDRLDRYMVSGNNSLAEALLAIYEVDAYLAAKREVG